MKQCSYGDCDRGAQRTGILGYCAMHYHRHRRGSPAMDAPAQPKTDRSHVVRDDPETWPRYYDSNTGYVHLRFKRGSEDIKIQENRWVMSKVIGRDLEKHEEVHHINGVRNDNRPENLELWSTSHPKGQRIEDKVAWAKEILALYDN